MQRRVLGDIESWNAKKVRKPLILMGARQVGKTWLMEEFAKRAYPGDTVAVNFMADDPLRESFEHANLAPDVLIGLLQARSGKRIIPGKTLLVLDEIQESPRALTSLKFFNEEMPELAVMAAGSLLGLSLPRRGQGGAQSQGQEPQDLPGVLRSAALLPHVA